MVVTVFSTGPLGTNAYLYHYKEGQGILIDAPPESYPPVAQFLNKNNLSLSHLLLTHSHWDHIADAALFKKAFPELIVAVHPADRANLENPGSDGLPCRLSIQGLHADHALSEGEHLGPFEVLETPGHTPGGVCFYDRAHHLLFSGDTVFKGSIGNLSLATARPELMWQSLEKLAKLPDEVVIYPGHGEKTTRGQERWLSRAREIFG